MAISKNFVVKNGLEVDTDTLFVDHVNRRTGVATTSPRDNLDVRGGIIATTVTADNLVLNQGLEFINAAGIATFVGLAVTNLSVSAGSTYSRIDVTERFNNTGMTSVTNFRAVGMSTHEGFLRLNQGLNVTGITTLSNRLIIGAGGTIFQTTQGGKVAVGTDTAPYRFSVVGTGDTVFYVKGNVRIDGILDSSSVAIAGIAATSLDVTSNFTVGGITTFTGAIDANGGATIDNIQLGVTGNNEIDTSSGNLTIDSAGGTTTIDDNLSVSGFMHVTGAGATFTANVDLLDDDRLRLGTGQDLQIYHNSSNNNSIIAESGSGQLVLQTNAFRLLNAAGGENMIDADEDGAVTLYHNANSKLETTSTGLVATGIVTATTFVGNLTGDVTGSVTNASGATGDFSIADKIVHTGDTNTAIRFPAADTFTVETSGSEALRVDSSQKLLVGATSSTDITRLGQTFAIAGTDSYGGMSISGFTGTTAAEGPIIDLQRSRATSKSVGTGVADNDRLGSFVFRGDDGTDFADAAYMLGEVDGTPSGGYVPGRFTFYTGTASAVPVERVRITSAGQVLVGGSVVQGHANMDDLQVGDASGHRGITISSGTSNFGTLAFGDSADGSGTDRYAGFVEYYHDDNSMRLGTSSAERLRITSAGLVRVPDDGKFTCGAGDDLEIYHNGSASFIHDNGTGDLNLCMESGSKIVIQSGTSGSHIAEFKYQGAAELYHNGTKKLETTSGGATISGTLLPEANNTRDLGASGTAFANVYATTFTGALTGNSSTATEATNFTVTANNSTNETVYPVFVDGATGTQGAETDTGLTYNPSTGLLTATAFSGSAANLTALPITVTHTSYTGTAQITYSSNTITISATSNAYGTRTVSTSSPSGGANGDIWYQYS